MFKKTALFKIVPDKTILSKRAFSKTILAKAALFILVLLVLFFTPVVLNGREEKPAELNVMVLSGPTGLTLLQMIAEEPELSGVKLNYSVATKPEQLTARLVSGEADIAALPTNLAAVLYNRGIGIRLAAITNWGVTYIVGRDPSVRSWQGLKGRELAVTGRGTTPDILLRYFLKAEGLDPEKDLKLQYYAAPVELAQLVIAGKVDLATLPEPWVTEVIKKNPEVSVLLDYQEAWKRAEHKEYSYPQTCLVVRAELAEKNPELVRDFLTAAAASSAWVNNHPDEAGQYAEQYLLISAAAAREAIPCCNLEFVPVWEIARRSTITLRNSMNSTPDDRGKTPDGGLYLH